MSDALHPLLKVALEAHGGHDRWVKFKGIGVCRSIRGP
jgi:hypothetical protein